MREESTSNKRDVQETTKTTTSTRIVKGISNPICIHIDVFWIKGNLHIHPCGSLSEDSLFSQPTNPPVRSSFFSYFLFSFFFSCTYNEIVSCLQNTLDPLENIYYDTPYIYTHTHTQVLTLTVTDTQIFLYFFLLLREQKHIYKLYKLKCNAFYCMNISNVVPRLRLIKI